MDWFDEVRARDKRGNQVLFAKDSAFLEDLRSMIASQSHRALVLWALDLADESVTQLASRYPNDSRPREALDAACAWAAGEIKMRQAQQKILACHAVAKDIDNREDIAMCHAVGQACSVVHTVGHAIGCPLYDLTALVRRHGIDDCAAAVEARKSDYVERLIWWSGHPSVHGGTWASFIEG